MFWAGEGVGADSTLRQEDSHPFAYIMWCCHSAAQLLSSLSHSKCQKVIGP